MKKTSRKAYQKVNKFRKSHQDRILEAITSPMNALTIAHITGLTQIQVSRRTGELEKNGLIYDTGIKGKFTIYNKTK